MGLKRTCLSLAVMSLSLHAMAHAQQVKPSSLPLLLVGASYADAKTPYNQPQAPLGGIAVGFGSYLSLGAALTRNPDLPGYVINEGQAGGTTFARLDCLPGATTCGPAKWDSYLTQLQHALTRVGLPPNFTQYNAKYVVILTPNDCLHSDAFGTPQAQNQPCTPAQLNQVADRLIEVGAYALSKGITPIYDIYPAYNKLDLNLFRTLYGLNWVIGQPDFHTLRHLTRTRIHAELPAAIQLDIWQDFVHMGDGIHPTPETARKAAKIIAKELLRRDPP